MAQPGDTITYTYNGGSNTDEVRQAEDVSSVNEMVIDYCDGAGGDTPNGSNGGRVENVVVDITNQDTLYIWVASTIGRYNGGAAASVDRGGGSTEIALVNTDGDTSPTEPFIAAAGGGATELTSGFTGDGSGGGARGGSGFGGDGNDGEGDAPPLGGDGEDTNGNGPTDGGGAVAGHNTNATILETGTTISGGGSGSDTDGEVQINYKQTLSPPDPPSNLSAEVQ